VEITAALLETNQWDVQVADFNGKTAIAWAAGGGGHEVVVKVLLEQSKVNPDPADTEYGRTPLSWAAENGHEGAVNVMLELNNVNPDRADKWGRTPLSYTHNPVGG